MMLEAPHLNRGLFLLFFFLPVSLFAQEEKPGNWIMYFGTNRVSEKFSIHTEIQFRNHTITPNNTEQLLLRAGLNYHFSDRSLITAGYAYIPSYIFESEQRKPETTEHRIWQQFISTDNIGRVKLEHRYRIEQRWVNQEYKNRIRYRLMLSVPLNKPVLEKGSLFLGFYDEIFMNTKKTFFDRNRLYGALGYQFSKNSNIQAGMMHQQVNDFGKWYLQFALVLNTDFRKQE
jgi:long-subunit fatty acid transport protein